MPDRKDHEQMSESGNAPKEPSPESIRVRSRADLSGPALRRVISDLVGIFEVAVVDTAPFPAFSDSLLLAQEAESVVLVARADRTREDKLMESLELLRRHEVRIAGVVLNDVRIPRREKRHYRYYFNRDNQAPEVAEDVKTRD